MLTLLKQGWKPKRTIIYCVWDGEEPGLLGSTEWGEAHADELRQHAVAYINSDGNGRGYLDMGGSHTLEKFINGVARDVEDPEKKITGLEARPVESDRRRQDAGRPERSARTRRPAHRRSRFRIRLDRLSRSPRVSLRSISAMAMKMAAESTTPSTTISTGTPISPIPISATAARSRKPPAPR